MSVYLIPIGTALLIFPLLTAFITLPYIILQYRKYGSISPMRVAVIYSFIFYLLCAYFLVIMPLPPMEEVAQYTKPIMQLVPFESLREFSVSTSLVWNDPSTYWTAFNEPSLFLIVFNIFLTIPFGMYLRYYFQFSWKKTLCFSFALTLSFELLQISALLGIYPRPYRLFDVDDLITNTLGGMLGYVLTPLITHFLPTRARIDEVAYDKGKSVSALRRAIAFFLDLLVIMMTTLCILFGITIVDISYDYQELQRDLLLVYIGISLLYVWGIPMLTKGKTLGKAVVNIRLVKEDGSCPKWYEFMLHFFALFLLILPSPYYIFLLIVFVLNDTASNHYIIIFAIMVLSIGYLLSVVQCGKALFTKQYFPWFDSRSKLHNVSTIELLEVEPMEDDSTPEKESIEEQPTIVIEEKDSFESL